MTQPPVNPIEARTLEVVRAWSKRIRFFPRDDAAIAVIANRLLHWLGRRDPMEQLEYLSNAVFDGMSEWKGIEAIREIFLRRYPMPKGVETYDPETGTRFLDSARDPIPILVSASRDILEAPRPRELPAPRTTDDEPFDDREFLQQAMEAMRAARRLDLKHGGPR